jgi:DNA-directed RNA polymerase I subunit RPA43
MLSLIGSIQPDPFSPEHKPLPAKSHASPTKKGSRSMRSISEEASVRNALTQDEFEMYGTEALDEDAIMEDDMNRDLSANEREKDRQIEVEKQEKRERKRKRREEKKSQKGEQDGDTAERMRKKKKKDEEK